MYLPKKEEKPVTVKARVNRMATYLWVYFQTYRVIALIVLTYLIISYLSGYRMEVKKVARTPISPVVEAQEK